MSKLDGTSYDSEMILFIGEIDMICDDIDMVIIENEVEAERIEELKEVLSRIKELNDDIKYHITELDKIYDEIRKKF